MSNNILEVKDMKVALFDNGPDFFSSFQSLLRFSVADIPVAANSFEDTMLQLTRLKETTVHAVFIGMFDTYGKKQKEVVKKMKLDFPKLPTIGMVDYHTIKPGTDYTVLYGHVADEHKLILDRIAGRS